MNHNLTFSKILSCLVNLNTLFKQNTALREQLETIRADVQPTTLSSPILEDSPLGLEDERFQESFSQLVFQNNNAHLLQLAEEITVALDNHQPLPELKGSNLEPLPLTSDTVEQIASFTHELSDENSALREKILSLLWTENARLEAEVNNAQHQVLSILNAQNSMLKNSLVETANNLKRQFEQSVGPAPTSFFKAVFSGLNLDNIVDEQANTPSNHQGQLF